MSRSGYIEDCEQWDLIRWRGAVASAIRGKNGQLFLLEMLAALDALPSKCLIQGYLEYNGEYCALGSVGRRRGLDMSKLDPYDTESIADIFRIPTALAAEIEFMNDEESCWETPEQRFESMRNWILENLRDYEVTTTCGESP